MAITHQRVHLVPLATHPDRLYRVIGFVNRRGTWAMSKGDKPMHGIALSVVWAIEALGIFGCAFIAALGPRSDTPFCDACGKWCSAGKKIRTMKIGDAEEMRRHVERRDWAYLNTIGDSPDGATQWFSLFHHHCPGCNNLHTLTLKSTVVTRDAKGNVQSKAKVLVDRLLVSPQDIERIQSRPPAPAVQPPPVPGVNPTAPPPVPAAQAWSESDSGESRPSSAPQRNEPENFGLS
jgi:hypothetical protein